MTRFVLPVSLVAIGLASSSSGLAARQSAAPQVNQPGMPTVARTYIQNRGAAEAIPVTVQPNGDVMPVTVMNLPPLTMQPSATVGTRAVRQIWDYRQMSVPNGTDVGAALSAAGADGWELVAAIPGTPAAGATQWILKRPR